MKNNIKAFDDREMITTFWTEAFGDSREDICFFLDNCSDYQCIGYFSGNKLKSMLFLVNCKLNGSEFKYIYAASTFKKYRGEGCMSDLLEYCKSQYKNICLIPADEKLAYFYSERGFDKSYPLEELDFAQTQEITEYLFEGCALPQPFVMSTK